MESSNEAVVVSDAAQEFYMMDRARQLQERLGLTNEQTKEIAEILYGQEQTPPPEYTDPTLLPNERFEARRARRRAMNDQIRSVLTPEQQVVFDTMRREFMAAPGGGFMLPPGGFPRPPGSPETMRDFVGDMNPDDWARTQGWPGNVNVPRPWMPPSEMPQPPLPPPPPTEP